MSARQHAQQSRKGCLVEPWWDCNPMPAGREDNERRSLMIWLDTELHEGLGAFLTKASGPRRDRAQGDTRKFGELLVGQAFCSLAGQEAGHLVAGSALSFHAA
jgi:hypothetical protein